MGKYPKIGIRPTIDGRQGGVREAVYPAAVLAAHGRRACANFKPIYK